MHTLGYVCLRAKERLPRSSVTAKKVQRQEKGTTKVRKVRHFDRATLPALFSKFQKAFQIPEAIDHAAHMEPIVFCFCVLDKKWAILKVFAPQDSLETYCKQFFDIGYVVRGGEIRVEDPRGWVEVLP